MAKSPAAIYQGTCTGHGIPIPGKVHSMFVDPCGVTPMSATPYSIAIKNKGCLWRPFPIAPASPLALRNVLINGIPPVLFGDVLTPHTSETMHTVISSCCSPESCNPTVIKASCSMLTVEDGKGVGHPRIVKATTKNVLVNGRPLAKVGDPMFIPCKSKIASGSKNVLVGGGSSKSDESNKADNAASSGEKSPSQASQAGSNAGSSSKYTNEQWQQKLADSDAAAMREINAGIV